MRAKHIFLILTAISAVLGFTAGGSMYLELGRPMAGIFFGLFLITTVLQKESDLYEQQLAPASTSRPARAKQKSDREVAANPALTTAQFH